VDAHFGAAVDAVASRLLPLIAIHPVHSLPQVDEFQDTSAAQLAVLLALAPHGRITARFAHFCAFLRIFAHFRSFQNRSRILTRMAPAP
jgi:hypothetical protein